LLTSALPATAQAVDGKAVDAVVQEAMQSWQIPGASLAIVRNDEVIYLKGYGVREAGTERPVTPDTLFAIASCTKAFIGAAMARLVDDGKLRWDDPVRKHVPFFRLADPLADSQVTLRDLLCHRTGLSRHDLLRFATGWEHEEVIRRVGLVPLTKPFRTTYQYNNIMYTTAGLAVGSACGGTWEEYVRERFFGPLGMTTAVCTTAAAEANPNLARPHWRKPDSTVAPAPWMRFDRGNAAGSIHASARDMANWVRFQLGDGTFEGNRVLSKAQLDETHTPQMVVRLDGPTRSSYPETAQVSYAFGWNVHDHRGHAMLSHTGGLSGYRARIVLAPKAKLGVVFLMNSGVGSSPASAHYVVTNHLLDLLLDLPKKDWNAHYTKAHAKLEADDRATEQARLKKRREGTKPSRELADYAATYEDAAYGPIRIVLEGDRLTLAWGRVKVRLEHFHYDTFLCRTDPAGEWRSFDNDQVVFQLDAGGTVGTVRFLDRDFRRLAVKQK
jgi:CubicO group peptidase (beta-lactamase class C family)